jgi:hypothetical protein
MKMLFDTYEFVHLDEMPFAGQPPTGIGVEKDTAAGS